MKNQVWQRFRHPNDFHHTAKQTEHDTKAASVRGANPSVADAAKNVCTRDVVCSIRESILIYPTDSVKLSLANAGWHCVCNGTSRVNVHIGYDVLEITRADMLRMNIRRILKCKTALLVVAS